MTQRRSLILAAPAFVLSGVAAASPQVRYTLRTAPDEVSRDILSMSLRRPDLGPYDKVTNLHVSFPQIIEQNFARLSARRAALLIESLEGSELEHLAQAYTNATINSNRRGRLHELLAIRLDGAQLGRTARAFGFAPLYGAIHRWAPEKSQRFIEHSSPLFLPPTPGAMPPRRANLRPVQFRRVQMSPAPSIEMTLLEIYLDYRTAPIGSLSPTAALYQTSVYSLGHLTAAYGFGFVVGTGLSWLLQTYAPSIHQRIGEGLYNFFTPLFNRFETGSISEIGGAQMGLAYGFELGGIAPVFAETGGDYGVVSEWSSMAGGGGCGSNPDGCPIME